MGTRMDVLFWGLQYAYAQEAFQALLNEVNRLEGQLSQYDENSPIAALNRDAGVKPVHVSQEVLAVLSTCRHYFCHTRKLFDVTAATRSTCKGAGRKGAESMELNKKQSRAFLPEKGMRVDLGGIGKGIALRNVRNIVHKFQITHAFISFGESSILGLGRHPYGPHWQVGVANVLDPQKSACSFALKDLALSTSGNTPAHKGDIIHPRTHKPMEQTATFSVLTESPVEAEVLSTALLIGTEDERISLLKKFNPVRAVEVAYTNTGEPRLREYYLRASHSNPEQEVQSFNSK